MKTGSVRKESDAVRSTKAGAMCGVMKHKSPVNVPPPRQPSWHALQYAADYLPIFRYDQESGSFCFPDDKRLISSRDNKCNGFNRRAPVFISYKQCGSHHVYQYNLWYGLQKGCGLHGLTGGRHGDDNEYVQVWVRTSDRSVDKVRYNQHNGYYFRSVGGGAEMNGKRVVVYIGKIAHGAYHRGCTGNPFRGGTRKCLGINWALALTFTNCAYWEDYRNPKGKYDLDQGQLIDDPSPREIDCNPGVCRPGHSYSRAVKDSSCYGVNN